ncbi:resolvase [Nitrobacter sp. Nb-311A]|nr:resolvase [Nitrobacter sp. Nb-311A]
MTTSAADKSQHRVMQRAALYLRVSTARQAEHDVSIPDQKRQGEAYCEARGLQLVETFIEPGASATNDRRPEFQRMIEAGTSKPAPFDVVVVHSFSRFFRDHFELEFYVRKLAKNGVKLVSIMQEMGDDPMHVMMRQIMALFDEYQSKENAKHVIRALKENARQGFWNGSLPPIGYRVVAAEQRGAKTKKKLEIDPLHADTVRLIYRLALEGDGTTGQIKNIVSYLNSRRIFTRDGGRWGHRPGSPHPDPPHLYGRARVQQAFQDRGIEAGQRDRHRSLSIGSQI